MSGTGVKVDDLAEAIRKQLQIYSDEINSKMKNIVKEVAEVAAEELRQGSPRRSSRGVRGKRYRSGAYARSWGAEDAFENNRTRRIAVRNKPHYSLTHLLENGHRKRGGKGVVSPRIHIAPVEEKAIKSLEEKITEAAKG